MISKEIGHHKVVKTIGPHIVAGDSGLETISSTENNKNYPATLIIYFTGR